MEPPPPSPPIRKTYKRYNVPGHVHFLTFSCFHRRPFLNADRSRGWMIDAIALARERHRFDLWAWDIMPEHVHLLILPRERAYDISDILTTMKQSVAKRAIAFVKVSAPDFLRHMADTPPNGKTSHRFWQRGGGFDHNLWSVDRIWDKIHYIHWNPVTRELVKHREDWPWSSYRDFAGLARSPLPIDRESIPFH